MSVNITILPSDLRADYACRYLASYGAKFLDSWENFPDQGILVTGIPFTKNGTSLFTSLLPFFTIDAFLNKLTPDHILVGGNFPQHVTRYCKEHDIMYYDLLQSPSFGRLNTRLTAEGLLAQVMSKTPFSILEAKILLIGYGRCGKEIARIFSNYSKKIVVTEKNSKSVSCALANGFKCFTPEKIRNNKPLLSQTNIIINTAPDVPIAASFFTYIPSDCYVFQVASGPLLLPETFHGILINCPGIPGKYAPKTAGSKLAAEICKYFNL
ncbi:MAG: hypothetical protein ACI4SQ_04270 [Eubacterium sp.]